jgi:hypothetical protein
MSLIATLSMAAFAASAYAVPGSFGAEKYPATVKGSLLKSTTVSWGSGTQYWSCTSSTASASLGSRSQTASVTPSYTNCSAQGTGLRPALYKMNGCSNDWTISAVTGSQSASGSEAASCAGGKQVEFVIYENQSNLEKGIPQCSYTLPNTPVSGGLTLSDSGSGSAQHVAVTRSLTYASTVTVGSKALCGASAGSALNLDLAGQMDLTASSSPGVPTGLAVSAGDLFAQGEASEVPEKQPRFNGSWAPTAEVALHSEGSQLHKFAIGSGIRNIECGSVSYVGAYLEAQKNSIYVGPNFGTCTSNGSNPTTVSACAGNQKVQLNNAGPAYTATLSQCETTITVYENQKQKEAGVPMCKYVLPAQGLGASVANVSNGVFGGVQLSWNASNVSYTTVIGSAGLCGKQSLSPMTYTGGASIYAN